MNRQNAFRFSAIAAIGLALLPANVSAQQGIAQQLVGAWTIVSWQDTAPNGTKREITNPKGLLIFDATGRYAQVIARDDRPKFKSPSQPTVEELVAATEQLRRDLDREAALAADAAAAGNRLDAESAALQQRLGDAQALLPALSAAVAAAEVDAGVRETGLAATIEAHARAAAGAA